MRSAVCTLHGNTGTCSIEPTLRPLVPHVSGRASRALDYAVGALGALASLFLGGRGVVCRRVGLQQGRVVHVSYVCRCRVDAELSDEGQVSPRRCWLSCYEAFPKVQQGGRGGR
jgi:hypothetical protein